MSGDAAMAYAAAFAFVCMGLALLVWMVAAVRHFWGRK